MDNPKIKWSLKNGSLLSLKINSVNMFLMSINILTFYLRFLKFCFDF